LQKPRHISAGILCGRDAFIVLVNVTDIPPDANRLATRNDHVRAEQEVEQRVERMHRASPPLCDDSGSHFALEEPVVCKGHETGAIDQCFHLGSDVAEIDRRTQDYAVSSGHLLDAVVDDVVVEHASAVPVFKAFHAGCAPPNPLACKLDQFGLNTFVFEFLEYASDQDSSVAVLSSASVDGDNLCHSTTPNGGERN